MDENEKKAQKYFEEGNAYAESGMYDLAIARYNKAIELNPDYSDLYVNRGNAYGEKDEYDQAIKDYTYAIRLDPAFAVAYFNRGNLYKKKDEYDKAIKAYTYAIKYKSTYVAAYNNRGTTYSDMGEYDKAIKDYTYAIKLDPSHYRTYFNIAGIYSIIEKYDEAIAFYERIPQSDHLYEVAEIAIEKTEMQKKGNEAYANKAVVKGYNDGIRNLDIQFNTAEKSFKKMVIFDIIVALAILGFNIFIIIYQTTPSVKPDVVEATELVEAVEEVNTTNVKRELDWTDTLSLSFVLSTILALCLWLTRYHNRRLHEIIHIREDYKHKSIVYGIFKSHGKDIKELSDSDPSALTDFIKQVSNTLNKNPADSLNKKKGDKLPIDDFAELISAVRPILEKKG